LEFVFCVLPDFSSSPCLENTCLFKISYLSFCSTRNLDELHPWVLEAFVYLVIYLPPLALRALPLAKLLAFPLALLELIM